MPSSRVEARLNDILTNAIRIERFTSGMDLTTFERDDKTVFATLHALLIWRVLASGDLTSLRQAVTQALAEEDHP